jgi:hypothetical protein
MIKLLNEQDHDDLYYNSGSRDITQIPNSDQFDTGDIVLFSDITYIPSRIIEWVTGSKYSHVGIILKDPTYINPLLKGTYILESTGLSHIVDSEDNKTKTGVQIRDFESVWKDYNGAIFWRKLNAQRDDEFIKKLVDAHTKIYDKPYDVHPIDWFKSMLNDRHGDIQVTTRFFCSALVTYLYDTWGFVPSDTPWTIIRPKDLGTENVTSNRMNFINCTVDNEIMIKGYDLYVHYVYNTF